MIISVMNVIAVEFRGCHVTGTWLRPNCDRNGASPNGTAVENNNTTKPCDATLIIPPRHIFFPPFRLPPPHRLVSFLFPPPIDSPLSSELSPGYLFLC